MSDPQAPPHDPNGPPCTESQLLALHTSNVCLARALVQSGALNRDIYRQELMAARTWLGHFDECGHNVAAFDGLLEMLMDI
ncbi:hypothetical protein [uncultured Pseudacidovorax sp.]|uniref:hypothetical protein n=1 Tax=uncultured Pseudacidovorax sp. TaxID=679313 RepID=UPI0025DC3003|nr:hypothetical protein [uncultured Pseudacidovorax sp.]